MDPPALKTSIEKLAIEHGAGGPIKPRIDPDVEEEYSRHREFLQRSVAQLKKYLEDGSHSHMLTNSQLMGNNLSLIDDINGQRESNRKTKGTVQAQIGRIRQMAQVREQNKKKAGPGLVGADAGMLMNYQQQPTTVEADLDPTIILERNRQRLLALRAAINELESRKSIALQPAVLAPVEGLSNQAEPRIAFYTQAQTAAELVSPRGGQGAGEDEEKGGEAKNQMAQEAK